jgi:hypothetical protein
MTTIGPLCTATVARSASSYRITVAGHLDDHWADWLGGHTLTRNDDASTTITVEAVDQSQLHGVLNRIRDIGADLLAISTPDRRPARAPDLPDPNAVPADGWTRHNTRPGQESQEPK